MNSSSFASVSSTSHASLNQKINFVSIKNSKVISTFRGKKSDCSSHQSDDLLSDASESALEEDEVNGGFVSWNSEDASFQIRSPKSKSTLLEIKNEYSDLQSQSSVMIPSPIPESSIAGMLLSDFLNTEIKLDLSDSPTEFSIQSIEEKINDDLSVGETASHHYHPSVGNSFSH
jgi:hypothetical protein